MISSKNNKGYNIRLEVFTIKLGAIYCRCTKMKTGVKTLKTAVIYDVMNKTCCLVDLNDPGGGHLPSTFVPTAGHLTVKVPPPPGICHP